MLLTNQGSRFLRKRAASSDWWTVAGQTCVAAYKAVGALDLPTSYVNLANPGTYNAAPDVAPGLAAGGWSFNGIDQYLTTGITPTNNQQWSMIVRFSGAVRNGTTGSKIIGCVGSSTNLFPEFALSPRYYATDTDANYANGQALATASGRAAGIMAVAGTQGYMDGAADGAAIAAKAGTLPQIYIGRRNIITVGTAAQYMQVAVAAVAIYSTTLSAADVAALSARMAALA